jgi:hypothetical protein
LGLAGTDPGVVSFPGVGGALFEAAGVVGTGFVGTLVLVAVATLTLLFAFAGATDGVARTGVVKEGDLDVSICKVEVDWGTTSTDFVVVEELFSTALFAAEE